PGQAPRERTALTGTPAKAPTPRWPFVPGCTSPPRGSWRSKGKFMAEPLRIALAGLGTVGAGVIRLIDANADLVARRAGRPIVISAVSARDRSRDRGV